MRSKDNPAPFVVDQRVSGSFAGSLRLPAQAEEHPKPVIFCWSFETSTITSDDWAVPPPQTPLPGLVSDAEPLLEPASLAELLPELPLEPEPPLEPDVPPEPAPLPDAELPLEPALLPPERFDADPDEGPELPEPLPDPELAPVPEKPEPDPDVEPEDASGPELPPEPSFPAPGVPSDDAPHA